MHLSRCAHSPGRRPHLIPKMFALSSLVLATTLLSTPTARAGTWQFTCTGSGTNTLTFGYPGTAPRITHWTPPGPQTGRFDLGSTLGDSSDYSVSDTATLTVTVTATWQSDPNLPSDPAPPKVWLCESAQANWSEGHSGSAADGLSDPYQAQVPGPGGASSSDTAPAAIPPTHWTLKTVSGGTVTLPTRTLTAEADFSPTTSRPYGDFCTAQIASYSVTVHPQPYNYRRTPFSDITPPTSVNATAGALQFHYSWSSTDGNIANLTTISVHENVDAPPSPSVKDSNGNPSFAPDYPPFNWLVPFHSDPVSVPGTDGRLTDFHSFGDDPNNLNPNVYFHKNYKADSFNLTQTYKFHDSATMQPGDEQIIPGNAGPFTITDAVVLDSSSPSGYSFKVTKDGATSLPQPLP